MLILEHIVLEIYTLRKMEANGFCPMSDEASKPSCTDYSVGYRTPGSHGSAAGRTLPYSVVLT